MFFSRSNSKARLRFTALLLGLFVASLFVIFFHDHGKCDHNNGSCAVCGAISSFHPLAAIPLLAAACLVLLFTVTLPETLAKRAPHISLKGARAPPFSF